jgi:hypothetical protein
MTGKEKKRRKKGIGSCCLASSVGRREEREGKQNNGDSAQYKNGVVSNHLKKIRIFLKIKILSINKH